MSRRNIVQLAAPQQPLCLQPTDPRASPYCPIASSLRPRQFALSPHWLYPHHSGQSGVPSLPSSPFWDPTTACLSCVAPSSYGTASERRGLGLAPDPDVHMVDRHAAHFASTSSDQVYVPSAASSPYVWPAQQSSPLARPSWRPLQVSMSSPGLGARQPSSSISQPPRQIRFVANDGQPHLKRRRISAADDDSSNPEGRTSPSKSASYSPVKRGHRRSDSQISTSKSPGRLHRRSASSISMLSHFSEIPEPRTLGHPLASDEGHQLPTSDAQSGQAPGYRVSFFRHFGPTAIVPGFKKVVVQMEAQRSSSAADPPSSAFIGPPGAAPSFRGAPTATSQPGAEARSDFPFYEPQDVVPNSPLIAELVDAFFVHLGCNFPFLQREPFVRDVAGKRVEPILVNAVCALSARFSAHPLLTAPSSRSLGGGPAGTMPSKPEQGQPFAQRAKSAVSGTFSCPSVAVVQACLLLAYEEFGSGHDSGVWMYLGIAIRMAQDLGMQKLKGIRFAGRRGPTPKTAKKSEQRQPDESESPEKESNAGVLSAEMREQGAAERGRVDTFWAVFFLDRVISSGTGRPVTLRDKDVELSFPSQDEVDPDTAWPAPFPSLIRIIHIYGRVTDLLNNITEAHHVTPDKLKRLAGMERDLTGIYQRLSPRLHFNVVNFQHYVKLHQGTNFILLHFWFHALIVLMHQPTLLHSFGGRIQQLFPTSQELSMSSAKTIADILAFAELLDARSFIGNPYSSQPMYIAACAFLMESTVHAASDPTSRGGSLPPAGPAGEGEEAAPSTRQRRPSHKDILQEASVADPESSKHSLLATAANQNYQRCYKALKALESYWAGTKYIITVLDQKARGVGDPLLYTTEEMESALQVPRPGPTFTRPEWRTPSTQEGRVGPPEQRQLRRDGQLGKRTVAEGSYEHPVSPTMDPNQAIGWSVTGTTDSSGSNPAFLYQSSGGEAFSALPDQLSHEHPALREPPATTAAGPAYVRHSTQRAVRPFSQTGTPAAASFPYLDARRRRSRRHALTDQAAHRHVSQFSHMASDPASQPEAEMSLGLSSPYPASADTPASTTYALQRALFEHASSPRADAFSFLGPQIDPRVVLPGTLPQGEIGTYGAGGDIPIGSQDMDMSGLGAGMMPWLDYLPHDVLDVFERGGEASQGQLDASQQAEAASMPPGTLPGAPPASQ
ncbi:MAG: hypothetical protein M1832_003712 [Thelocarpon impressellum]|nr:MAG: hypothetical protein M1832_003712 [Thelocarpon impressellum]